MQLLVTFLGSIWQPNLHFLSRTRTAFSHNWPSISCRLYSRSLARSHTHAYWNIVCLPDTYISPSLVNYYFFSRIATTYPSHHCQLRWMFGGEGDLVNVLFLLAGPARRVIDMYAQTSRWIRRRTCLWDWHAHKWQIPSIVWYTRARSFNCCCCLIARFFIHQSITTTTENNQRT